jgi:methionyl-tRNA synthetase
MPREFFITTAIDYTNSPPHIGHAYEKVLADVIARYQRMKTDADGKRQAVFFLTGVDQHGQKVQQSAAKAGVPPSEFVRGLTQKFVDLWEKLDVKYDEWAETTAERHKKVVQGILQRLRDEKQIYKDKQAGYYSIRQEQFLTDKERGPDGEFGAEWGQVEFREEENYYFKLEQHKKWLLSYIDERKDAVIPDFRRTELRNAVEKLSGDLCISRPKSRLDWGIELPFDKDFVTYVWFDALTNYISFAGYDPSLSTFNSVKERGSNGALRSQPSTFRDKWPALQIIGKDILIPAHGIYWLIMLHAIGFPDEAMPQLLVHGWWNLGGAKMSKTAGNVIDPFVLIDKYGAEALRYYLMSDIVIGKDADFSEERLVTVFNSQLSNALGNLLNRAIGMTQRYCNGALGYSQNDRVSGIAGYTVEAYNFCMSQLEIGGQVDISWRGIEDADGFGPLTKLAGGLGNIISFVKWLNQSVEQNAPWKRAKAGELSAVAPFLYQLVESLRIIAILISPVLPKAAHKIFDQLNWKMELSGKEERFRLDDANWGGLPDGHVVGKPVPLFPRIEIKL